VSRQLSGGQFHDGYEPKDPDHGGGVAERVGQVPHVGLISRPTTASLVLAQAGRASDQAAHWWAPSIALIVAWVSKLGLDGSVVNVVLVKHSPDIPHDPHKVVFFAEQDMNTGDMLRLGQLPDVQLVD